MLALALARRLQRHGLHYAWIVAATAFLAMLSSSAALGLPGVLIKPLGAEFGWKVDDVSGALALRFSLYGFIGPFAALAMQRFGLRRVAGVAMALIGAGLLLALGMDARWQLVALWGVTLGVGSGLTAMVLGATVANQWFERRRGLVLGMLTASSATGQLVFLPLAAWLMAHHGWRAAVAPAATLCAVAMVACATLLRHKPEDLGLRPYGATGEAPATPATVATPAARLSWWEPLRVLREASRSGLFWLLAGTFFVCGLSTNGLIQTHFITLCGDYGLDAVPAASVLAMIGAFDFVGTLLSGWLSDRVDNRTLLFWYYGLRGLSLLWLPHADFTLVGLSMFAMFYGLDWVATVPPTVKLATQAFDRTRAPMVFGWVFAAHQVGAAVAAYGAGLSRSILLSYTPALVVAGVACLAAAGAVWMVRGTRATALQTAG